VERVDQCAIGRLGHRIDGQVAAGEVFFERYVRCGVEGETMVAVPGLAFSAGQRVFLLGLRVEEYRKILADRPEPLLEQSFRGGTDDDVVAVGIWPAEQFIADGAADDENLHGQRCALNDRRDSGSC